MRPATTTFLKDEEWSEIDGELCLVLMPELFQHRFFKTQRRSLKNLRRSIKELSKIDDEYRLELRDSYRSRFIKHRKVFASKVNPYARLYLKCKKVRRYIYGYIINKRDFKYLQYVFDKRTVQDDEEVIIVWTKKHYRIGRLRNFNCFPRLWIMICHEGTFDSITDSNLKPEYKSYREILNPIVSLKWVGMK